MHAPGGVRTQNGILERSRLIGLHDGYSTHCAFDVKSVNEDARRSVNLAHRTFARGAESRATRDAHRRAHHHTRAHVHRSRAAGSKMLANAEARLASFAS